jgi:gluconolactonase
MGVLANNPRVYDLVASSVQVEKIAGGYAFTEGPVWHPDGYLLFSDIPGDARHRWSPSQGASCVLTPSSKCNGMTLDADLRLLVCEHKTSQVIRAKLASDGTEASREVLATHYRGTQLNSPNDIVVARDGSITFTDPTYGRHDAPYGFPRELDLDFRGVYRLPPGGGELELLAADFEEPNGLCFSPDEKTLYIDDSSALVIRRFDVGADGTLSGGEVLIDGVGDPLVHENGACDGMKCDERGTIWVTGPGGIWIVSPDGEHLGTVEIPERTANLNWGGPDWSTLFVTATSSVYRFECKVRGNPVSYMR